MKTPLQKKSRHFVESFDQMTLPMALPKFNKKKNLCAKGYPQSSSFRRWQEKGARVWRPRDLRKFEVNSQETPDLNKLLAHLSLIQLPKPIAHIVATGIKRDCLIHSRQVAEKRLIRSV